MLSDSLISPAVPIEDASRHARLSLTAKGPSTGYVDGAWCPGSRDLAVELPVLATRIADRFWPVAKVCFALASWNQVPARLDIDGRTVRLSGLHSQSEHVIDLFGPERQRLRLLVIPPEASQEAGDIAMRLVVDRQNLSSPRQILAVSGAFYVDAASHIESALDRWETDGGSRETSAHQTAHRS
ncbi:DUF5994 family protein [Sciscionella marina]|uniref:DUF5994 family protein n=1 Tax=Sciscionella marina TaxID=508770 RepID=UPI0012F661E2|nr:DUF5994 family protein [Sciscionella marina]